MGENPEHRSSRGRTIQQIDYRKLHQGEMDQDDQMSLRLGKSRKSTKLTKSVGSVKQNKDKDKLVEHECGSNSSDDGRLDEIDREIEKVKPSLSENYNEYKVQQGLQERLEDAELPHNLEKGQVYDECKDLHERQFQATQDRRRCAQRRLELERIRERIIDKREQAKQDEWEADMIRRRKAMQCAQAEIDRRRRELEMEEMERKQMEEITMLQEDASALNILSMDEKSRANANNGADSTIQFAKNR